MHGENRWARRCRLLRARRVESMWRRLNRLLAQQGQRLNYRPRNSGEKQQILRWLLSDPPPGWRFLSALEAADVGHSSQFHPRPARRPTSQLPGSRTKVIILAARVAAGEDLWHAQDAGTRQIKAA